MTFPQAGAYPEESQATTILVLGILGLLCSCSPLGIAAWFETLRPLSTRITNAILIGTGFSLVVVWLLRVWEGSLPPV